MSISLNEKIRAQDRKNLIFIRYSRERSMRVFRLYMLLAAPIGAILYTIWQGFIIGLPPSGISSGFVVIDWMMEVGSALYVLVTHLIFTYIYFGIPLILAAGWFGYRTYRRGIFSTVEAGFISLLLVFIFLTLVVLVSTGSFVQTYIDITLQWKEYVPVIAISVISAMTCRWIAWGIDMSGG
ncbi:MAG: hypothetical protein ACRBBN_16250 [Methyloligellaceae bacterium]